GVAVRTRGQFIGNTRHRIVTAVREGIGGAGDRVVVAVYKVVVETHHHIADAGVEEVADTAHQIAVGPVDNSVFLTGDHVVATGVHGVVSAGDTIALGSAVDHVAQTGDMVADGATIDGVVLATGNHVVLGIEAGDQVAVGGDDGIVTADGIGGVVGTAATPSASAACPPSGVGVAAGGELAVAGARVAGADSDIVDAARRLFVPHDVVVGAIQGAQLR